jgi:hypothetical protein
MTADNLKAWDHHEAYMVREFGQDDSAWQLVRPPTGTDRRPVRMPSDIPGGPDRTVWLVGVTVPLADGTERFFNLTDEVEVREP